MASWWRRQDWNRDGLDEEQAIESCMHAFRGQGRRRGLRIGSSSTAAGEGEGMEEEKPEKHSHHKAPWKRKVNYHTVPRCCVVLCVIL